MSPRIRYLLRDGIVRLLQAFGHEVVATASTRPETLRALMMHRPDVAVIDVRMPPSNTDEGLRAALSARQEIPGLPVLVLSQHVEQLYARELLADATGGVGYLRKDRVLDAEQFIDSLERVATGGTCLDPTVVSKLLARPATNTRLFALTERELSLLELMAQGHPNQAITQKLHLSESAVSKYTTTMFDKLSLAHDEGINRRVLAVLAYLNDPHEKRHARQQQ